MNDDKTLDELYAEHDALEKAIEVLKKRQAEIMSAAGVIWLRVKNREIDAALAAGDIE
ncbi:hypothetical protein [Devosia sp. Leaf64]|uniref:hypothetical protein n=1 Tax=Devosia sp. Leaf64 TaxID=1736229 RepID=UPI000A8FE649|nr:hypothetical protein [Devosia sp. Leaf64]